MIRAENITIKRGMHTIVEKLDWEIKKQESWILYGLNGCGKTTLMSALAGYLGASKGQIYVDDVMLEQSTKVDWRKKCGFISASFFGNCYRAESNLDIVLSALHGKLGAGVDIQAADIRKAKALLNSLGLKGKWQYPFDTLSSGQRQKVLWARALITNPDILLLDEPFNGLDILGKIETKEILNEWKKSGDKTIVCVTHQSSEITSEYTHVLLLKQGKAYAQGKLTKVFASENMSNFLGRKVDVSWDKGYADICV